MHYENGREGCRGGGAQIERTNQKYPCGVKDRTVKSILESIPELYI